MKLKICRCRMKMESGWLTASGCLMGLAFFLQAVHYFAIDNILQMGIGSVIFLLILPMLAEAAWFVPLRGLRLDWPVYYIAAGGVLCLLILVQTAMMGDVIGAIVWSLLLLGAIVVLGLALFGKLRFDIAGWVLTGITVLRLILGGISGFLAEAAAVLTLAALVLFCFGSTIPKGKK